MKTLGILIAGILVLPLCGCYHSTLTYVMNPDGSGKVTVHLLAQDINAGVDQVLSGNLRNNEQKKRVFEFFETCKGIEAWKDVTYNLNADQRFEFHGTGYFKDLNTVEIQFGPQSILHPRIKKVAEGKLAIFVDLGFQFAKEPKELRDKDEFTGLTNDQIVSKMQTQYREMRPVWGLMMDTFQMEMQLSAPGKVSESLGFKKEDAYYKIAVKGTDILKALDDLATDKAWLLRRAKDQPQEWMDLTTLETMPELGQKLFGIRELPKLSVEGPLAPVFDYKQEIEPAKAQFEKLMRELGPQVMHVNEDIVEGKVKDAQLKKLRPSGAMVRWETDGIANGPSSLWDDEYIVSFMGDLPVKPIGITKLNLKTATTDLGESLIKKPTFESRLSGAFGDVKLKEDAETITVDLKLLRPSSKARLLKEISGEIEVAESAGLHEIDLGMMEFKKGAKTKALNAEITGMEKGVFTDKGEQSLSLELGIPDFAKKDILFFDEKGQKLDTSFSSGSCGVERFQSTFSIKGQFPPRGQIKVRLHKLILYRVPFKLLNITVAGQATE